MSVFPVVFQLGVALVVNRADLADVHRGGRVRAGGRVAWKYSVNALHFLGATTQHPQEEVLI